MQEIYAAIGFEEGQQTKPTAFPKEVRIDSFGHIYFNLIWTSMQYVKMRFNFAMKRAVISLTQDTSKHEPILSFTSKELLISMLMREGSMSVRFSVNTLVLFFSDTRHTDWRRVRFDQHERISHP